MNSPHFSRKFIDSIPDDNDEVIITVADEFTNLISNANNSSEYQQDFLEVYALMSALFEARGIKIQLPQPNPPKVDRSGIHNILQAEKGGASKRLYERGSVAHLNSKTEEYKALFSKAPVYEFSDEDYNRIQQLINELRQSIGSAVLIPADHKRRLLKRLEAMQAELHKRTSDIDRFWGFVAEAGIVTRKFGEDLKPITQCVNELGRIVIAVIMAKEGIHALPDIVKLLELK